MVGGIYNQVVYTTNPNLPSSNYNQAYQPCGLPSQACGLPSLGWVGLGRDGRLGWPVAYLAKDGFIHICI